MPRASTTSSSGSTLLEPPPERTGRCSAPFRARARWSPSAPEDLGRSRRDERGRAPGLRPRATTPRQRRSPACWSDHHSVRCHLRHRPRHSGPLAARRGLALFTHRVIHGPVPGVNLPRHSACGSPDRRGRSAPSRRGHCGPRGEVTRPCCSGRRQGMPVLGYHEARWTTSLPRQSSARHLLPLLREQDDLFRCCAPRPARG